MDPSSGGRRSASAPIGAQENDGSSAKRPAETPAFFSVLFGSNEA